MNQLLETIKNKISTLSSRPILIAIDGSCGSGTVGGKKADDFPSGSEARADDSGKKRQRAYGALH